MPLIVDQDALVERSKFALILYGRLWILLHLTFENSIFDFMSVTA